MPVSKRIIRRLLPEGSRGAVALRRIMKRVAFLLWMGLLVSTICYSQPHIVVRDSMIDFHTMYEGDKVSRKIAILNTGTTDLMIEHVDAKCECSVLHLDSRIVPPGDSTFLTLTFNSSHYEGAIHKYVIAVSNDLPQRNIFIHFRANKKDGAFCDPSLSFGSIWGHIPGPKLI